MTRSRESDNRNILATSPTDVSSLSLSLSLVTTSQFATDEFNAINKLQAANETIQFQIDQQR